MTVNLMTEQQETDTALIKSMYCHWQKRALGLQQRLSSTWQQQARRACRLEAVLVSSSQHAAAFQQSTLRHMLALHHGKHGLHAAELPTAS